MDISRHIVMVPIWISTLIIKPILPQKHPWKNKTISLNDWVKSGTPEARLLSFTMGFSFICCLIVLLKLTLNH